MSRRAGIILPRGWHWRVDALEANGAPLLLLTAFYPPKEEYRAWLAWEPGEGLLVMLARLEFHGSHPGWHCHSACRDAHDITPGQPLHREFIRLPAADAKHRKETYSVTEGSALAAAFRFYRVTGTPKGMLV